VLTKRRRADGLQTYDMILRETADLASVEGLDGLTIGSLAERLDLSKSGLFAHFGSKEELQLATIEAARQRYVTVVLEPVFRVPRGIARLRALCDYVLDYIAKPEFPGGCFFCVVAAEFHARPGPVRDAITTNKIYKRELLAKLAAEAQTLGELSPDIDTEQLAFELETVIDVPTWAVATENKERDLAFAHQAVSNILARALPVSKQKPTKAPAAKAAPRRK
jgi:AcrR family transcriptional regulator